MNTQLQIGDKVKFQSVLGTEYTGVIKNIPVNSTEDRTDNFYVIAEDGTQNYWMINQRLVHKINEKED